MLGRGFGVMHPSMVVPQCLSMGFTVLGQTQTFELIYIYIYINVINIPSQIIPSTIMTPRQTTVKKGQ